MSHAHRTPAPCDVFPILIHWLITSWPHLMCCYCSSWQSYCLTSLGIRQRFDLLLYSFDRETFSCEFVCLFVCMYVFFSFFSFYFFLLFYSVLLFDVCGSWWVWGFFCGSLLCSCVVNVGNICCGFWKFAQANASTLF